MAALLALIILQSAGGCYGETIAVPDLWGKSEAELARVFPDAKKSKGGDWEVQNWQGWKKVMLIFDTKSKALEMLFFTPARLLSEIEAKEAAQRQLGLMLPPANEVRAVGLIAYRDMPGKISTINFTYADSKSDRRIGEIGVFLNPPPMIMRPGAARPPDGVNVATVPPILGVTLEECTLRLGKPQNSDAGMKTFKNGGMSYRCRFFKGKCDSVGIMKADFEQFSDAEFEALREANRNGEKWQLSPRLSFGGETWEAESLSLFAVRWANSPQMVWVHTRASLERLGGPYKGQIEHEEQQRANL